MYVEEALDKTEKFLDASVLSGVSPVYIIHGKGTGALKSAIRDFLKRAHFVESFRGGDNFEGGEGISVVYLSKN
jgi:DNA mismatch repair protein MutS2